MNTKNNIHVMIFLGIVLIGLFVPVLATYCNNATITAYTTNLLNYTYRLDVPYSAHFDYTDMRDISIWNDTYGGISLPFEFDTVTASTESIIFVRDDLTGISKKVIACYGDGSTQWDNCSNCAWDDQVKFRYNGNPGMQDSSVYDNDPTNHGSSSVNSPVGKGRDFVPGDSDYIDLLTEDIDGDVSIMTIASMDTVANTVGLLTNYDAASYQIALWLNNAPKMGGGAYDGGNIPSAYINPYSTTGSWDMWTVVRDQGNTIYTYLNDTTSSASVADTAGDANDDTWYAGKYNTAGLYLDGKMDEIRIYTSTLTTSYVNFTYLNLLKNSETVSWSGEYDIGGGPTSSVTISHPSNATYYLTSITPEYTAISYTNSTFNCSIYYDTTFEETISTTNNTLTTGSSKTLQMGSHSVNVTCTDGAGEFDDIVYFTMLDYGVTDETYLTPVYETNSTTFTLQVNTSSRIDYVNASLKYDDVWYNTTGTQTGSIWDFDYTLNVPLIQTNNTNITFNWNYNATYTNTTVVEVSNTAYDQTVWFSFWFDAFTCSSSDLLEGDAFTCTGNINKVIDNGDYEGVTEWDSTNSTATITEYATYIESQISLTAPPVNTTTDYNATTYANVTYNSNTRLMSYSPYTISVYPMQLTTNCSGAAQTLIFNSYEETNATTGPAIELDIYFTTYNGGLSKNFNFSLPANTTHIICLNPQWGSIDIDMESVYSNSSYGYATRAYFLENTTLTNSSQTINLYSHYTSDTDDITFTVRGVDNLPKPGIIVQINRWFVGEGVYRLVAMGRSDDNGNMIIPLKKAADVWYQFILVDEGIVLNTYSQMTLTDTSLTLYTSSSSSEGYYDYYDNIAFSCTNVTLGDQLTLSCTVSDTSNTVQNYQLKIRKLFAITNVTVCTNNLSTASGTLTCTIANYTNAQYGWTLKATFGGTISNPEIILTQGTIGPDTTLIFTDSFAIFLSAILVLGLTGIGVVTTQSSAGGVIGATTGLMISILLGMIDLGSNGIYAAMGVVGIGIIIAVMVNE